MSINPDDYKFDEALTKLFSAGKYEKCLEASKEKLKQEPLNLQALFYMANISLKNRQPDDCIHYCNTIIRAVDERFYYVWLWRGQALCLQKKYQEAIESLEQAIKYNPTHRDTWTYMALNLFLQGKKDIAMGLLDHVEDKVAELKGKFTLVRGYIERSDGNTDEALMYFIQGGMNLDPTASDYEESKEVFAREVGDTLKRNK